MRITKLTKRADEMQGYLLDVLSVEAHEPVERRAVGHSGERASQMALSVAVEVSLAGESRPAGEVERAMTPPAKRGIEAGASLLGWWD